MASERETASGLYNRRQMDARRMELQRPAGPANLADILERVLDKGIVIAGDITLTLGTVDILTLKIRLLIASVDKAQEIGINWWESDPALSSRARELEEENDDLRERLERLEEIAGLPAPRPGEEVIVETRREEVVEEGPGGERDEEFHEERRSDVADRGSRATKDELLERAQELDVRGRSTMTKDDLSRAVAAAEEEDEGAR